MNEEAAFPTGPKTRLGRTHLAGLQGGEGGSGRASAGSDGWQQSVGGQPEPPIPGCH